jgi:hypothetical protein
MLGTGEIVGESGSVSARAKLVEDVFFRYLDARRAFSLALERSAMALGHTTP